MVEIPFKLLASIMIGFFAGRFIDNYFSLEIPVFTIALSMLGLITGIWSCLKRM